MCDILAAISYSYHERPRKRVKINMTIPSRPAPPPPQPNSNGPLRYTPTTDWDFCAFDSAPSTSTGSSNLAAAGSRKNDRTKKPPPPRPPPPKLPAAPAAPLKKPGQPQSINILSSLFGHKRAANVATVAVKPSASGVPGPKSNPSFGPVKLLTAPPSSSSKAPNYSGGSTHHGNSSAGTYGSLLMSSTTVNASSSGTNMEMQLISFDSPPSSPTFTQKSCSDCISVDSFSSDSNYSSPNNGNMSQAESGFEDDFVANANSHRVASNVLPWGDSSSDPFEAGTSSGAGCPTVGAASSHTIYARPPASFTAHIRAPLLNSKLQQADFVDPLCNGQSVVPKVPTMSMPTIIKPPSSSNSSDSQKSTPLHSGTPSVSIYSYNSTGVTARQSSIAMEPSSAKVASYAGMDDGIVSGTATFDSLPSHPMPSIPPPPPPSMDTYTEEAYGIALYDFEGETMEDLSFKTNEKIYLLKRLNDEWYMGRDKRGLEGMFPVNYVEVKVPLSCSAVEERQQPDDAAATGLPMMMGTVKVRALYNFQAETPEDLTIEEHNMIKVLYQITPEWLYGEIDGRRGQFPANYIEYVPQNLPNMTTGSS